MRSVETLEEEVVRLRARVAELEADILDPNLLSVAQQIPDNIIVLDRDERIRFINWTVPDLDTSQVLGTLTYDYLPAELHERVRACHRRVFENGTPAWIEVTHTARDGSVSVWETRVAPLRRGGVISGLIVVSTNITERKALETQLARVQKTEALGLLAGGMAHDFNNLVLTIIGNAEFAKREARGSAAQPYLDEIVNACHRAASLNQHLMALSREQTPKRGEVDLNKLSRDLIRMMRTTIPDDIAIELVADDALPLVQGDTVQLEQVVLNLCLNARDAMPSGGRLVIRSETTTMNGQRYATLSVSDTGTGIAPEARERVFEPFFTTKAPGEGSGLGLTTAYAIVEAHAGTLHVVTEPDRGTTFKMYLPAAHHAPSPLADARATDARSDAAANGGNETILVAEDAAVVRNLVVRVLEHAGYRVLTADDGAQAVERVREQAGAIDLALLDVLMPRMNGPEAEIEIMKAQPGMPVLFTSGHSDASMLGAKIPRSRIIAKPYQPDELLRRVRRALDSN